MTEVSISVQFQGYWLELLSDMLNKTTDTLRVLTNLFVKLSAGKIAF